MTDQPHPASATTPKQALSTVPCSVIRAFLAKHNADQVEWDAIDAIESCGFGNSIGTDLCLPPAYRTQANLWKAECFTYVEEVRKANKGIERLKRKIYSQNSESGRGEAVDPSR